MQSTRFSAAFFHRGTQNRQLARIGGRLSGLNQTEMMGLLIGNPRTMVREFSAGGVVLRMMRGRWHIATIEPYSERPKQTPKPGEPRKPHILALPKGTVDPGEKPRQTAKREVHEETGLRAEIISKLADIKYFYVRSWGDRARVFKVVSFYLFRYVSGKLGNITPEMRHEVQQCFWTPLEDAPKLLSYKGERQMAREALAYVEAHPELSAVHPVAKD
jgi:8-oxo-dGTP diphosphatase